MGAQNSQDKDNSAVSTAMDNFILSLGALNHKDALWQGLVDFITGTMGADLLSYHHLPPPVAPDRQSVTIMAHGFDDAWVSRYRDNNYQSFDPIAQRAAHALTPFRWSDVEGSNRLTVEQRGYMAALREWMAGDGLGVPAYGPSSRNGYFGVGCRDGAPDWARRDELYILWACQSFHIRYSVLHMADLGHDFELTTTEIAILDGVRMGRSVSVIAASLNKRPDTVTTVLSLIQKKMGVTDLGSAILRGISCGLLAAE